MLTDNQTTGSKLSYSLQRGRGKRPHPKVRVHSEVTPSFGILTIAIFGTPFFFPFTVKEHFEFITGPKLHRKRYSDSNHLSYFIQQWAGPRWRITSSKGRLEVMLASKRAELKSPVLISDSRRAGRPLSPTPEKPGRQGSLSPRQLFDPERARFLWTQFSA